MTAKTYVWERSLLFNKERKRAFVAEQFLQDKYLRGEGYTKEEALADLKEVEMKSNHEKFKDLEPVRFFYEL